MTDCVLTPISAERGICLRCDPEGRHLLFIGERRTCRSPTLPPNPAEIERRAAICGQCDESEVPLFQILCKRDRCGCGRTPLVRMVQRAILGTLQFFFLLMGLKVVLKKDWLAAIVFVAIFGVGASDILQSLAVGALNVGLFAWLLRQIVRGKFNKIGLLTRFQRRVVVTRLVTAMNMPTIITLHPPRHRQQQKCVPWSRTPQTDFISTTRCSM